MSNEHSRSGPETPPGAESERHDHQNAADEIRHRMHEMMAQVLKSGRVDAASVKEMGRAVSAELATASDTMEQANEAFSDAIRRLDSSLMQAAQTAHGALGKLAAKGEAFNDNDLKDALDELKQLQGAYMAASARVAAAASDNLQHDLREFAQQAQKLGTDASAQAASLVSEFAERLSGSSSEAAKSGLEFTREYGMRMAYVTSGVLAGIADALKEQKTHKKSE